MVGPSIVATFIKSSIYANDLSPHWQWGGAFAMSDEAGHDEWGGSMNVTMINYLSYDVTYDNVMRRRGGVEGHLAGEGQDDWEGSGNARITTKIGTPAILGQGVASVNNRLVLLASVLTI